MEWEAPGIVVDARPFGEGDAIVGVLTEAHGRHRGLVRGGNSRRHAALWQPGNLVQLRWVGRLAEQLGALSGELLHPSAALAMQDPLQLALLASACAVAAAGLPERGAHPRIFSGLLGLVAHLADPAAPALLIRWEVALLGELGFGLDLARCAVSGDRDGLVGVSPRSGRAVGEAAAGRWRDRLLALPAFLNDAAASGDPAAWRDGLRLTGHFLARHVFARHAFTEGQGVALPTARRLLYDRIAALAGTDDEHGR